VWQESDHGKRTNHQYEDMGALFAKDEEFLLLFRKKARGRERDVNVYIVGEKENSDARPIHTDGVDKRAPI
jgi:hypothetical protein